MTLVLALAVAVIAFFAWRGARARLRKVQAMLRRDRTTQSQAVTLEKDPRTGVYRERREDR